MQRKKKELHENTEVKDKDFDAILKLTPESKFELKLKTGSLTCYDLISKKEVKVKFKKGSALYNLLSGYLMLKFLYRKTRLIAVQIDDKSEAVVLTDKRLAQVEKKYKKFMNDWTVLFKNSLGVYNVFQK
jgi:hypothetical protein